MTTRDDQASSNSAGRKYATWPTKIAEQLAPRHIDTIIGVPEPA